MSNHVRTTTHSAAGDLTSHAGLRIDPSATGVRFTTRHLFGLGRVEGTMTVLEGGTGERTDDGVPVHVTLAASSFDTGHDRRDRDVRGPRFLDVAVHPTLELDGHLVPDGSVVEGRLSVGGVSAPVRLAVTAVRAVGTEGDLEVEARTRLDRYALGVTRAMGMAARHLDVVVTAVLRRQP